MQALTQRGKFGRKAENSAANLDIRLLLQPLDQHGVDPLLQQREFFHETFGQVLALVAFVEIEGRAPDLLAVGFGKSVEEFDEAGQKIGLGQDDVDGHAGMQELVKFRQAFADGTHLFELHLVLAAEEVGDRKRDECAVDRLRAAILAQKPEEAFPPRLRCTVQIILRGIAAGCVDQDRLVGEPPIAVAGATGALD